MRTNYVILDLVGVSPEIREIRAEAAALWQAEVMTSVATRLAESGQRSLVDAAGRIWRAVAATAAHDQVELSMLSNAPMGAFDKTAVVTTADLPT